jgi:hypothetical protein
MIQDEEEEDVVDVILLVVEEDCHKRHEGVLEQPTRRRGLKVTSKRLDGTMNETLPLKLLGIVVIILNGIAMLRIKAELQSKWIVQTAPTGLMDVIETGTIVILQVRLY